MRMYVVMRDPVLAKCKADSLYVRYWMAKVGAYLKRTRPLMECPKR